MKSKMFTHFSVKKTVQSIHTCVLYLIKYTSGLVGIVVAGLGKISSGNGSGFFTNTYTNVFSSSGGCNGIVGYVTGASVGAFINTIR